MADRSKPETLDSARCVRVLEQVGIRPIRIQSGRVPVRRGWMQLAPKGWPDWVIPCSKGRTVWWESKTPLGKLTEDQKRIHAQLRMEGHPVYVGSDASALLMCCRAAR